MGNGMDPIGGLAFRMFHHQDHFARLEKPSYPNVHPFFSVFFVENILVIGTHQRVYPPWCESFDQRLGLPDMNGALPLGIFGVRCDRRLGRQGG